MVPSVFLNLPRSYKGEPVETKELNYFLLNRLLEDGSVLP